MEHLRVGDKVLVAAGVFSDVYFFSHRLVDTNSSFVKITVAGHALRLSPDHYLYANSRLAVASSVNVGDSVVLFDGSSATVTGVTTEWAVGLYNPHTLQGDIIVNGVKTSTYTRAIAPALAHVLLWPARVMYQAGQDLSLDAGSNMIANILPDGYESY